MAEAERDRPIHEHRWEDALEPKHLIARCDVILRVGAAMLGAGTGSRRVVETMRDVAAALDLDQIQTRVSLTEIVLTVHRRGISRTQTVEVPNPGVNADQIAALQSFARDLPKHVTVREVEERLDAVLSRPKQWPRWAAPVGAGVACGAFAFLNHGGWVEIVSVFVAAIAGQLLRRELHRRQLNQLAMTFLAAVLAGLIYLALSSLAGVVFTIDPQRNASGLASAILFLIPGFPLMTAALDLARLDLTAGITRLTYATLLTFAAGFGVWVVAAPAGLDLDFPTSYGLPSGLLLALRALASFLGVYGFAVVFNSPPLVALAAATIALIANPMRLLLMGAEVPPQAAAAAGTLAVGLLAWVAATMFRLPKIILSVPSVVIMVPGASAFQALVELNNGDLLASIDSVIFASSTVLGMAIGLVAARMLTDPQWAFYTPNPPDYRAVVRKLTPHPPGWLAHDDD